MKLTSKIVGLALTLGMLATGLAAAPAAQAVTVTPGTNFVNAGVLISSTQTTATFSGTITDAMVNSGAADWFRMDLPSSGSVTITLQASALQTPSYLSYTQASIALADMNAAEIVSASGLGSGSSSVSRTVYLLGGTNFLTVKAASGSMSFSYALKVSFTALTQSFPETQVVRHNTQGSANAMSLGKQYTGMVPDWSTTSSIYSQSATTTYYKFTLASQANLTLTSTANGPFCSNYAQLGWTLTSTAGGFAPQTGAFGNQTNGFGSVSPTSSSISNVPAGTYYFAAGAQSYTECGGTYQFTLSITLPACPKFTDVAADNPFASQICWMAVNKITTGMPDGTYAPKQPVTREAMAAFMYRLAGVSYSPSSKSSFPDVTQTGPNSNQFYTEIEWMNAKGITTGMSDGTYAPKQPVTREAMAAFLYRLAGSPTYSPPAKPSFPDVSNDKTSKYYNQFYTEIEWMNAKGITTGMADGTYAPKQPVTREAMAAFMWRMSNQKLYCTAYSNGVGC